MFHSILSLKLGLSLLAGMSSVITLVYGLMETISSEAFEAIETLSSGYLVITIVVKRDLGTCLTLLIGGLVFFLTGGLSPSHAKP